MEGSPSYSGASQPPSLHASSCQPPLIILIIVDLFFFLTTDSLTYESHTEHKNWADFWIQYIRSGRMCQPPWLNANRTSHLPKIRPPMSSLPGNGHFLRTSQQFHRKRKWERHHFHLRIPFVIPTRNSVSEDWKLRLIKERVCQPVMINHKSICVSGWIHHW